MYSILIECFAAQASSSPLMCSGPLSHRITEGVPRHGITCSRLRITRHRVIQWCDAAWRARADREDTLRGRCSTAGRVVLHSTSGARVRTGDTGVIERCRAGLASRGEQRVGA